MQLWAATGGTSRVQAPAARAAAPAGLVLELPVAVSGLVLVLQAIAVAVGAQPIPSQLQEDLTQYSLEELSVQASAWLESRAR